MYNVTLIDTQGWFDSRSEEDNSKLIEKLCEFIKNEIDKLHRVFYVYRKGLTSEEIKCLDLMKNILSDDALESGICSLLVTHCDGMDEETRKNSRMNIEEDETLSKYMSMFEKANG